jgi:uncharacterized protein YndB with AHSA1/START domain
MIEESGRSLRIERTFRASADAVFDAWTSPEVMRRWLHAGADWETPEAEVDLRVGGRIRIVMRSPDGREAGMGGEFLLIDRPYRLVMTWTFDDILANEQLIELTFSETEGSTTVRLLNTRIATDERRDSQKTGWDECLRELGRVLEG